MKRVLLGLIVISLVFISCSKKEAEPVMDGNPFFSEFDTPFGTPPFDLIKPEHFFPAFEEGMKRQISQVDAIIADTDPPAFENTIIPLEYSGALLRKVTSVFFNLMGASTSEELQEIAKKGAPLLAKHRDDIGLNADLFKRIKTVYEARESLDLNPEQARLLEDYYKAFVRGGANLSDDKKARFREINEQLSLLSLQFGENILKENNKFEMVIDSEADLVGLPKAVISAAQEAAAERGHQEKWVFTLHKPSLIPFLQYSEKRELREKMFKGYINRGNNGDELDNKQIAEKIASLRLERAALLGYETHAHFVLEENMAKKPENVYRLLNQLWVPALKMAQKEARDLQAMIKEEGHDFKLQPWDWWYYAEKLKKAKYALDDEILRPYFLLENVRNGAFEIANKLWGMTFEERTDIPIYHPDVKVFEVKDSDGSHLGILYTDYHPRASKRGGAWMNAYRKQFREEGQDITPVVSNVFNFSKPTADRPALLTFEEVSTLLHEFGHALHGLLSDCTYPTLSGTDVPRDFVELPSQIMENWASEPEVLRMYARHFETGEPIPQELIDKLKKAGHFNQGFATVEYLAASFLDMDWHTISDASAIDCLDFEEKSLSKIGLIPEIVVRYRSSYFNHIFSGGYSAGYYSYIWSEVLDADAFQAFKENGLFDRETAQSFRDNILSRGGTEDPMTLFVRFRGSEPNVEALLKRKGLN